ncbi:MAG TPA: hypothetical protein DEP65_13650 [Ruminococcus sp.]|nr:hypothetical protein [Ruminococcus sp.]
MTDKMAKAKVIEMIYSECAEMMINKENSKRNLVSEWRQKNPNRTQYACWKETGISRITVKKWWNSDEEYENEKIKFKTRLNELIKCESAADDESWHIISWNYISENRYTESNKAQTFEIRRIFKDKKNVIIKPKKMYFYVSEDESEITKKEMTSLIISKTWLFKIKVSESEYAEIERKAKEYNYKNRNDFLKATIVSGLKETKKKSFIKQMISEIGAEKKSIERNRTVYRNTSDEEDVNLVVDIDILYQNINIDLDYVIDKMDIIRYMFLNISPKIKNEKECKQ